MILGIVGSEAAKFTEFGEISARLHIQELIERYRPEKVSSGHCHLGGIDIWAEVIADAMGVEKLIFPPKSRRWEDYKARNIQIAKASDIVYCLSVDSLPETYAGMTFKVCYHCIGRDEPNHIKSGGCWTTKYARSIYKDGKLIVIHNADPLHHPGDSPFA